MRPLSLLDLIFITGTVVVIGHLILSYDRMMGFTFRMTQTDFVMAIIRHRSGAGKAADA